jgi:drug/metabolite transporter (DMT)-like permease
LAAALTTALAWSPAGLFVQAAAGGAVALTPLGITAARFALSFLALLPVVWTARRNLVATARMPVAWTLAAVMIGYYLVAVTTFTFTTVAEGTLLINSTPLFALAIRMLRRQPVTRAEITGALIAFGGLCVILLPDVIGGSADTDRLIGAGLGLAAALAGAVYALVFAQTEQHPDPGVVTLLTFAVGATLALPLMPSASELQANAGALIGLGLIVTALPTLLYSVASSRLPAVLVTTIRLLTPIVGTLLAVVVWNERLGATFWIGAALVLAGLYVLVRPPRR